MEEKVTTWMVRFLNRATSGRMRGSLRTTSESSPECGSALSTWKWKCSVFALM